MDANHPLWIERKKLYHSFRDTYSAEHFPGSKAWFTQRAAERALEVFDAAHPEVQQAIKAERDANPPSYRADPNSHYNRALRGED